MPLIQYKEIPEDGSPVDRVEYRSDVAPVLSIKRPDELHTDLTAKSGTVGVEAIGGNGARATVGDVTIGDFPAGTLFAIGSITDGSFSPLARLELRSPKKS